MAVSNASHVKRKSSVVYKISGKRLFLCAPIHHHFQFKGWPETKITMRFFIIAAIMALFSLITLKL